MLSVIIPTFNEKENVREVSKRISRSLKDCEYEILFIDDSTDETPEILSQMSMENKNVRFVHRTGDRGLATAVTLGFKKSRGEVLSVMDADLQHPPELLKIMLDKINLGADLVVSSRFIPGGSDGGLQGIRKVISRTARLIAWVFLKRSRRTTDPMSGFFMLRKNIVKNVKLNPIGWKILLEILVKGNFSNLAEVPYRFQPRLGDCSKMSLHEQLNYLRHILRLVVHSPEDIRFWKFALVGTSGVLVNMAVYFLLLIVRLPVVLAGTLAAVTAMFSNFVLNSRFTWPDSNQQQYLKHLLLFYIFCGIGIGINGTILAILTQWMKFNAYAAQMAGILAATMWNFTANNRWNWRTSWEELEVKENDSEETILE